MKINPLLTHSLCLKNYQKAFRIMKLSFFIMFVCVCQLFAVNTEAQNAIIQLKSNKLSIEELFKEIENQTDYLVVYSTSGVRSNFDLSLTKTKAKVSEYLDEALKGHSLKYEFVNNYIILSNIESNAITQQGQKKITGVVLDQNGQPVIGANVVEKGTTNGTITDVDGKFTLEVDQNASIRVSYIGYIDQEVSVKGKNSLRLILMEDSQKLYEVVVTALGIKRSEKALGYAAQKLGGEKINVVKNVDATSGLIGKVAGLNISSSSEFNQAPSMSLRGESPLLVIDGVPYTNISLRDIAPDDIEEMNVLKGATASALYGSRGGSGAIIVTTKKGNQKGGLDVSVNSSTMFEAGYVAFPEVQTSYSSGMGGKYGLDYVWGDKLDIGRTALLHNPYTYEWEETELVSKGKDNLKNFLETGLVTNNNISISHQGEKGNFRTSFTHVFNKGAYPNNKLNKFTFSLGGNMNVGKFSFEGSIIYNKRFYPNNSGTGYGKGGYMYNLVLWHGAEYDIRDYKNYWVEGKENEQQNWMDDLYYDNPYFISYERRQSNDYDVTNGFMSMKYDFAPWLNVTLRSGFDYYSDRFESKYAQSAIGYKKGYYSTTQNSGFSNNTDLLLMANHSFGKFSVDGMIGGTINYRQSSGVWGSTRNGLSIPGFYSLNASVDPASTGQSFSKKQVNGIYGKVSLEWDNKIYVDVTGRNDWSSSLPESTRSYFYPSIAGSLILSEFIKMPEYIDFIKIRGSWTKTKNDIGVYDTNNVYSLSTNIWNGLNAAYYPSSIRGVDLLPSSSRSYELGLNGHFFKNRLWADVTYYNKVYADASIKAPISDASGFSSTYLNSEEEIERRGVEVSIGGTPVKNKEFQWDALFNWSLDRQYYKKLDPLYSSKNPWVKEGGRTDIALVNYFWDTDPEGNIVHGADGLPVAVGKKGVMGHSSPDWIWGVSNTLQYKGFTLNIAFDGCVGGLMFNRMVSSMWHTGVHPDSDNQWRYDEVVNGKKNYIGEGVKVISGSIERDEYGQVISDNRVYAKNDIETSYESYIRNFGDCYSSTPKHMRSRTFIKLRELSLSYTVPAYLAKKVGMNDLSLGFVGNNLLLWTKDFKYSDPDRGYDDINSPSTRYVGFNVKFSF